MKAYQTVVIGFMSICFLSTRCMGDEIHRASAEGDLAKVQTLVADNKALTEDKDEKGRTPLHLASYSGHIDVVKFLLDKGADTETKFTNGSTALFWPIPEGHIDVFKLLIDREADTSAKQNDGTSLLHIAAAFGKSGIADILINRGLDPNVKQAVGSTPLAYAVSRGHKEMAELLINRGAEVNSLDNYGTSPAFIAAFRDNKEILGLLISRGANLNQKNTTGNVVLHEMARRGKTDILAFLVDNGADVTIRDGSGQTPFILASNHGYGDIVELMLKKGVDVNQTANGGDAALHGAAWIGDKATAQLLIAHGADINARNTNGRTPLDIARVRGQEVIVNLLTEHRAEGKKGLRREPQKAMSGRIVREGMDSPLRFTILYDNYTHKEGTQSDWGFSCLIEGTESVILFDTGTKPNVLVHNADHLGVDFKKVGKIVISHDHYDHIGGLPAVLDINHDVSVYMPVSFAYEIVRRVEGKGARVVSVDEPVEICPDVYSTGEMGDEIKEQSLIINTKKGLIIITGCSHQGIVNILKQAKKIFDRPIHLVFGGFHLRSMKDGEVEEIIRNFREIGVVQCGATHCTGDRQIELFKQAFGKNYIQMGTGKILKITF